MYEKNTLSVSDAQYANYPYANTPEAFLFHAVQMRSLTSSSSSSSLHFVWGIAEAKCILVTAVCVFVTLCVWLSLAAFTHYCTDPDVSWGKETLVVHYWADLQSTVHGFPCYDNTAPNAKCQRVLVLDLCLVIIIFRTLPLWQFNCQCPSRGSACCHV